MPYRMFFIATFLFVFANDSFADPYGPTINEVAYKYAITRNFQNLIENLSRERIDIRLGMTFNDVEKWAKKSSNYILTSKKNSVYVFEHKDGPTFHNLSFDVVFRKGKVVMIKTHNLNDFEFDKNDAVGLKPLKEINVNECWSRRNYIDPNSMQNGYDFALLAEIGKPNEECMGSDRANITIGEPGLLYPKHVLK